MEWWGKVPILKNHDPKLKNTTNETTKTTTTETTNNLKYLGLNLPHKKLSNFIPGWDGGGRGGGEKSRS